MSLPVWTHARNILVKQLKYTRVYEIPLVFPEETKCLRWSVERRGDVLWVVGIDGMGKPPTFPDAQKRPSCEEVGESAIPAIPVVS